MDRAPLFLVVFVLAAFTAGEGLALRCGSDLVSRGDRKIEVLAKCGEPMDREERRIETVERVLSGDRVHRVLEEERRTSFVEEWVYDFGPSRLLVFLWFRDGRLVHEETGGYGYAGDPGDIGPACWSESLARGRRKYEVLRQCGAPASRDLREVERARREVDRRRGEVRETRVTVTVEEWVYNFGPNRLLYVFTFENGRVVGVETAGYGF